MENITNTNLSVLLTGNPLITFGKNVYKQHTNCFQKTIPYNFENNRVKINPLEFPIDIIHNMWITQCDKIKKLSLFLVGNLVDISQMTVDSVNDADNIQIIHKMSINGLKSLNNLHEIKNKPNTLEILYNNIIFIPNILNNDNRNKKLVLIIDPLDNQILNDCKLIIKYLIPNSVNEINRFQQVGHEYLCKRLVTNYYKINKGFNRIMLSTNNLCTSHFVVNTPLNMANDLNITFNAYFNSEMGIPNNELNNDPDVNPDAEIEQSIHDQINSGAVVKNKYILDEVFNDPSYGYYMKHNCDTYVFDAFKNIKYREELNIQPAGHLQLKNESNLVIQSKHEQSIDLEITFCTYDILRIIGSNVYFTSQYMPPVPPVVPAPEPVPEPVPELVPPVVPIPPVIIPNPIVETPDVSKKDKIENYGHLILTVVKLYEWLTAKRRHLDVENDICLITLDKIKYGAYYYACEKCHKPFDYESYKWTYVSENYLHRCPHCRCTLQHYPPLYINKKTLSDYKNDLVGIFVMNK